MNFKNSLGILFLAGALGCAAAYYFPNGPPHKPSRRQASPNPDDSTFHPQPKQLNLPTQKPSDLPPPPQNPGDDEAHPPISKVITLGSESNPPEPRMQSGDDDTPHKPEPKQTGGIQTVPVRKDPGLQGRQSSRCQTNYAFTTSGQSIRIRSKNYPRTYPNNLQTSLCLTSPSGTQMEVSCDDFNVEQERSCSYDYLGIGEDLTSLQKFCGRGTFRAPISSGNKLAVVFKSDSSNPGATSRSPYRFQCTVTVTGSSPPESTAAPPSGGGGDDGGSGNCRCGRRNDGSRIVGGVNAKPNSLPWRCYLRTDRYDFFCGCSIISNKWILTAAHCTAAVMPLESGDTLYAVVGAHDRNQQETTSRSYAVKTVYDHEGYDDNTMDNDISLLELRESITYSNEVSPVCLPINIANESYSGETVTASGWGRTTQGGSDSKTLKEVDLPVLTTQQCSRYYPGQLTENMICTYNPGKDTCQGDSGGSIDMNRSGNYYAIGVVSWGIGCAQQNNPGVYAKTGNYINFIREKTNEEFCQP